MLLSVDFDDILHKLSVQWQDDSVEFIHKQMSIFKTVAIVVMGIIFMWMSQVCSHCNSRSVMQHNFKRYYYG